MNHLRDTNRVWSVWGRLFRTVVLITLAGGVGSCQSSSATATKKDGNASGAKVQLKAGRVGAEELERMNRAFADRYVMRLSATCDQLLEGNADEGQCREAREIRATGAMAVYDIVTESGPYLQTLNLTVAVTLQRIVWVEEKNGEKMFGERGRAMATALNASHAEVMEVAGKIFSPAELGTLDTLLREWRRENPGLKRVANARFTDLMSSTEGVEREKATGLFAQIEETRQSVDDARVLGERALYLGKRMPLLLAWRTEATLDALTGNPRVADALRDFHAMTGEADRLLAILESARKAKLADLDQRQPALDATVKNVRETVTEAATLTHDAQALLVESQKAMAAFEELMKRADAIASRYVATEAAPPVAPAGPVGPAATEASGSPAAVAPRGAGSATPSAPGRRFDIQDYTAAMKEASQAARDLNTALISSQNLLDSPTWHDRIEEINAAADGRVRLAADQSRSLVARIFRDVFIALGGLFVVLVMARVVSAWIMKKWQLQAK